MAVVPRKRAGGIVLSLKDTPGLFRWATRGDLRPAQSEWREIMKLSYRDSRHVYFIQAGGRRGPVKIGITKNLPRRLTVLQSANARKLRVICVVAAGGRDLEESLHLRFSRSRLAGEWFSYQGQVADYLKTIRVIKRFWGAATR